MSFNTNAYHIHDYVLRGVHSLAVDIASEVRIWNCCTTG